jgi:Ca2+-binding RTX toxin-like protein
MALTTKFIYADTVGAGFRVDLLEDESVYVKTGVLVGSTDTAAIEGETSNHQYTIDGDVFGFYYGIQNSNDLSLNNHVTVGLTGTLGATFHSGIWMSGGAHTITNFGQIRGGNGITMFTKSEGTHSTIVNHGIIHGDFDGIGRQNDDALENLTITNYGTISGGNSSYSCSGSTNIEEIVNKGLMIGNINLGGGNDLYDGRLGTLDGYVLAGAGNDIVYGNADDEKLFGEDGNDVLIGGAGADYLSGGAGSDQASYASAKAAVVVSLANPAIAKGDADGDTFNSIENLGGSRFHDSLFGNSAKNAISGVAGNDTIKGYGGNDILTGGDGADLFVFNSALSASSNVDRITDFTVADDTMQIDNLFFAGLPTGTLAASAFAANSTGLAADASDRVIYEFDTGKLFFDADGNGAGARVQFATLAVGVGLTTADFVVI